MILLLKKVMFLKKEQMNKKIFTSQRPILESHICEKCLKNRTKIVQIIMSLNEACLIREIKRSCTFRRLAEIYYPKENELHGMQFAGEDLCKEALKVLYPEFTEEYFGEDFDKENKSYIGDFYWWE